MTKIPLTTDQLARAIQAMAASERLGRLPLLADVANATGASLRPYALRNALVKAGLAVVPPSQDGGDPCLAILSDDAWVTLGGRPRNAPRVRPCMCCRRSFLSTGNHHRMCPDCRRYATPDMTPYQVWR